MVLRKRIILIAAALLAAAGILTALAPDTLSMIILLVMGFVLVMGFALGLLPSVLYALGFSTARQSIDQALEVQTAEPWYAVFKLDSPFRQKDLDELFRIYRDEAEAQREDGEVVSDIEECPVCAGAAVLSAELPSGSTDRGCGRGRAVCALCGPGGNGVRRLPL